MIKKILPNTKILIVAPHADDESIGCGGILLLYGKQCDIWVLTDGRHGHTTEKYSDEDLLIMTRQQELKKAAKFVGVKNVKFQSIEDGRLAQNMSCLLNESITKYDYVFIPNRYESHPDHKTVYYALQKMISQQNARGCLIEYEVWTPLRRPDFFLDISAVSDKKKALIEIFESQLADVAYAEKALALNCYRGIYNGCAFAEAYSFASNDTIWRRLWEHLSPMIQNRIKKLVKW